MRNFGESAYPVTFGVAPEFKRERDGGREGEEKEREGGGRGEEKE